jgi:ATP phosphoribosyltransferase regulatory subunit
MIEKSRLLYRILEMAEVDGSGAVPQARGRAAGFSDWLVGPAGRRRALTETFVATFESWGYGFIATPLAEPLQTVAAGVGPDQQSHLFRFMDADGELLAMVGERTVSVARVVATQLQHEPLPVRVCYAGPVLRSLGLLDGRRRESMQAGCEVIGSAGLHADAECIALAAAALERGGVHRVQVDVGHANFVPALLRSAGLDERAQREVLGALARRDLVAVEAALERTEMAAAERRLLLAFPTLRGGREILDTAAEGLRSAEPRAALDDLARLWDLLEAYAIHDRVHLDLGSVRDWDYYTGPTFEVFSIDAGFPLGGGGRYDTLLQRFGLAQPATGFVLHVDRCHDVMHRRGDVVPQRAPVRVAWAPAAYAPALDAAQRLRDVGIAAVCDLESSSGLDAMQGMFVDSHGARWNAVGRGGEGAVDAAVTAIAEAMR